MSQKKMRILESTRLDDPNTSQKHSENTKLSILIYIGESPVVYRFVGNYKHTLVFGPSMLPQANHRSVVHLFLLGYWLGSAQWSFVRGDSLSPLEFRDARHHRAHCVLDQRSAVTEALFHTRAHTPHFRTRSGRLDCHGCREVAAARLARMSSSSTSATNTLVEHRLALTQNSHRIAHQGISTSARTLHDATDNRQR